jgi:hypothetical protein
MKMHLRFLRESEAIQRTLEKDDWAFEWRHDGSLMVRHDLVRDEIAGRSRLHHLGLLTTSSVRIEFVGRAVEHE